MIKFTTALVLPFLLPLPSSSPEIEVDPGLERFVPVALAAWAPYHSPVKAIKWCHNGPIPCKQRGYSGYYNKTTKTVYIHSKTWEREDERGRLSLLVHELGHSFGLPNSIPGLPSVMVRDWSHPEIILPTEMDRRDLRILGVKP